MLVAAYKQVNQECPMHYPEGCIIAKAMRRSFHFAITTAMMWFLALAAAFTSARYFLVPPRLAPSDSRIDWAAQDGTLA
jgi:hypothetical protein